MDQQMTTTVPKDQTLPKAESRAGQEMLIAQIAHVTNAVESLTIERLDTLINRLQALKQVTILENKAVIERVTNFINMIDDGLRDVAKLEELTTKLEQTATTS